MTGRDVQSLQLLLNHHLGLPLKPLDPDGIFGNETRNRVIEFQKRNRMYPVRMQFPPDYPREFRRPLKIDGIVGQHTLRVLIDIRKLDSTGLAASRTERRRLVPAFVFALLPRSVRSQSVMTRSRRRPPTAHFTWFNCSQARSSI
jgi:peptidoglycan hydrolase-like protein with peptidoglycan-binding domain